MYIAVIYTHKGELLVQKEALKAKVSSVATVVALLYRYASIDILFNT